MAILGSLECGQHVPAQLTLHALPMVALIFLVIGRNLRLDVNGKALDSGKDSMESHTISNIVCCDSCCDCLFDLGMMTLA